MATLYYSDRTDRYLDRRPPAGQPLPAGPQLAASQWWSISAEGSQVPRQLAHASPPAASQPRRCDSVPGAPSAHCPEVPQRPSGCLQVGTFWLMRRLQHLGGSPTELLLPLLLLLLPPPTLLPSQLLSSIISFDLSPNFIFFHLTSRFLYHSSPACIHHLASIVDGRRPSCTADSLSGPDNSTSSPPQVGR